MIDRQIDSPSPKPFGLVVWKGWKWLWFRKSLDRLPLGERNRH